MQCGRGSLNKPPFLSFCGWLCGVSGLLPGQDASVCIPRRHGRQNTEQSRTRAWPVASIPRDAQAPWGCPPDGGPRGHLGQDPSSRVS